MNRGGCTIRRSLSRHRCAGAGRTRAAARSHAQTRCNTGCHGLEGGPWGWGEAVGVGRGLEGQGTLGDRGRTPLRVLFLCLETPKSRGFSGSTDAQPCVSRFWWHCSLTLAGSDAAAGVWTGDKETARVSDGREGQKERKKGRGTREAR